MRAPVWGTLTQLLARPKKNLISRRIDILITPYNSVAEKIVPISLYSNFIRLLEVTDVTAVTEGFFFRFFCKCFRYFLENISLGVGTLNFCCSRELQLRLEQQFWMSDPVTHSELMFFITDNHNDNDNDNSISRSLTNWLLKYQRCMRASNSISTWSFYRELLKI